MTETAERRKSLAGEREGSLLLPEGGLKHLQAALEQMDLLLQSQRTRTGLCCLVELLRHLSAVRDFVR